MLLESLPPIQQLILKRAIERSGEIRLADLSSEVQKLVRYRASAALHQNSILLERKGIIERRHEGRAVIVRVKPEWIQPLRAFLGIKADPCYVGLLSKVDPPQIIRNSLDLLNLSPRKVLIISDEEGNKHMEELSDLEPTLLLVDSSEYRACYEVINNKIRDLVRDYEIFCDLSGGNRVMMLALNEVARKYSLRRFFVSEAQVLTWLHE